MTAAPAPRVGLWVHRTAGLGERTGVGRYALELSRALADLEAADLCYGVISGRESEPAPSDLDGLPQVRLRAPRRPLHLLWSFAQQPRIERLLDPPDLLHVLFPSFPVPTRLPLVGTVHDLFALDHPLWYGRRERRAVVDATQRIVDTADRIVCVSQHVKDQVVERFDLEPDRVRVVHSGVADAWHVAAWGPQERARSRKGRRPYVVAVGSISSRKNLAAAVAAVAPLEGIDLVLAGPPGDAVDAVRAAAERHGMDDRLRLTGPLPLDALVDLVRGAEALLHVALDEGFGFPPVEAMAAGTPTLVTRSGALPEVVGTAGTVLDGTDPEGWTPALSRVLGDPEERRRQVARGKVRAAELTWDRAARETSGVHREVLRSRGVTAAD